jgi:hypothetical protein
VRCATERHDQHNAFTLELESRSYQYPTGYNVPRDEMPDAATWKVTYLQLVGAVSGKVAGQVRRYHRELWEAEGH